MTFGEQIGRYRYVLCKGKEKRNALVHSPFFVENLIPVPGLTGGKEKGTFRHFDFHIDDVSFVNVQSSSQTVLIEVKRLLKEAFNGHGTN